MMARRPTLLKVLLLEILYWRPFTEDLEQPRGSGLLDARWVLIESALIADTNSEEPEHYY